MTEVSPTAGRRILYFRVTSLIEKKTNERPPAMHRSLGWRKQGYINQKFHLDTHRFQGIAGRSNTESRQGVKRPTSNMVFCQLKKNLATGGECVARANRSFEILRLAFLSINKEQRH
jgi:hypothetical protein